MTEKREWWSDDLIAAVSDAMKSKAEAAIARVRELHVEGPHQTCMVCATWKTWADGRTDLLGEPWPCSTIRILDCDSDE